MNDNEDKIELFKTKLYDGMFSRLHHKEELIKIVEEIFEEK